MIDTFMFLGGTLIGAFIGSLVTLIYHLREIRQEARQNYVRLSLAQSEVVTLERKLEIHRRSPATDFTPPLQRTVEAESEAPTTLSRIPAWLGNCESPIAAGTTSNGPCASREKIGSDLHKSQVLEDYKF